MPVSEPPWVNQAAGTAPRNGTTSHTISFGFTSTSGNELVVVVYGAVTHAAAGWTERLQPVSSGELSVFTKTSAGDSSITVTHNAANFPAGWVAYEFLTGSVWSTGTGGNVSADTFPELTGLPGVEVVVFAARGRVATTTGADNASSVWSAPWVEDADLFTADDGATDGCYLTVGHQINVTATSVTPAAATSYTGSFPADRQHVVFALEVASAGGTTHAASGSGASVSAGSAAVVLQLAAAVSGASVSAGAAAPGGLLAAVASAASVSGGFAAATVPGSTVSRPFTGIVSRPFTGIVLRP